MANIDIKEWQIGENTYKFKDEAARQQLATKQDAITQVTASADTNVGTPSVTPTWNNGTLDFAFYNIKGEQGVKGDTVILGDEEEYTLYNTTGSNTNGAMTQAAVTDALTVETNGVDVSTYVDALGIYGASGDNRGAFISNGVDWRHYKIVNKGYKTLEYRVYVTNTYCSYISLYSNMNISASSVLYTKKVTTSGAWVEGSLDLTQYPNAAMIVVSCVKSEVGNGVQIKLKSTVTNDSSILKSDITSLEAAVQSSNASLQASIDAIARMSITAEELETKNVKPQYRIVNTGVVNKAGTAGTAVLIPNKGYSNVSVSITYWTGQLAAIAFYNSTSYSKKTLISSVNLTGTSGVKKTFTADVPEGCKTIGFTINTNNDSLSDIILYSDTLDYIKNIQGENGEGDNTSLNASVLLHQTRAITTTPVTLLHISDVHGHIQALSMIRKFYMQNSEYIDNIINTGDLAANIYNTTDATNYYDLGYTDALFSMGNHDGAVSTGNTKEEWIAAGRENCYNTYFAHIDEWGVTQPTDAAENYLMYYYKDYATAKVRLIVLDNMFDTETGTSYHDDQLAWFKNVLKDTVTEGNAAYGFTIVVASHYIPGNFFNESIVRKSDGDVVTFHSGAENLANGSIDARFRMDKNYPSTVQDFIDGNGYFSGLSKGNFAVWLCGHHHADYIAYAWNGFTDNLSYYSDTDEDHEAHNTGDIKGTTYSIASHPIVELNQQTNKYEIIGVDTQNVISTYPVSDILMCVINRAGNKESDLSRELNQFIPVANAITITSSSIRIVRYGYNLTTGLRPINVLSYNYKTKKVTANY